jgi:DNA polymerase Ligase (LigD)
MLSIQADFLDWVAEMPRFVILEHDWPERHWDLMLEDGAKLRTWRLATMPAHGMQSAAQAIGVHRLHYLDYEGPVSGGRGSVARWDAGDFAWQRDEPDSVAVILNGGRCQGVLVIERKKGGAFLASYFAGDSHAG